MGDKKSTLTFVTESLPEFIVDEPYELWLQVDGGTEPITYEIEGGEFPGGITLSSEGYIMGTPLAGSEDTTVFITVSDATTAHQTQAFDCEVHEHKDDEDEAS
jgi:hypothetical protein